MFSIISTLNLTHHLELQYFIVFLKLNHLVLDIMVGWPRAVSCVSSSSSLFFSFSSSFIWRSCCLCSSSSAWRWACSIAARPRLQGNSGPQPALTLTSFLPPPPPCPLPPCSCSSCCLSDATWEKAKTEVKPTERQEGSILTELAHGKELGCATATWKQN